MTSRLHSQNQARLAKRGAKTFSSGMGVRALEHVMGQPAAQIGVLSIDWSAFNKEVLIDTQLPLFFDQFVDLKTTTGEITGDKAIILNRLIDALPQDRMPLLTASIQDSLAKILKLPYSQIPEPKQGFFTMGIDSLMAVELKNRLEIGLQRRLSVTLIFNHSNIEALAEHLLRDVLSLETTHQSALNTYGVNGGTRLVKKVENLSDDEIASLIAEEYEARQGDA